jgi:hypothetical protein
MLTATDSAFVHRKRLRHAQAPDRQHSAPEVNQAMPEANSALYDQLDEFRERSDGAWRQETE